MNFKASIFQNGKKWPNSTKKQIWIHLPSWNPELNLNLTCNSYKFPWFSKKNNSYLQLWVLEIVTIHPAHPFLRRYGSMVTDVLHDRFKITGRQIRRFWRRTWQFMKWHKSIQNIQTPANNKNNRTKYKNKILYIASTINSNPFKNQIKTATITQQSPTQLPFLSGEKHLLDLCDWPPLHFELLPSGSQKTKGDWYHGRENCLNLDKILKKIIHDLNKISLKT